jgi:hypothetical protein
MVVGSLNQSGAIAVLIARISTGFIKAKSLFWDCQQYITRSGVACQLQVAFPQRESSSFASPVLYRF